MAILGSVGGALAAILNLFSGTYVLFLPLVLPVVSLLSALQREGLIAEDNRRAYDTLRTSLARDSSSMLADARGAIDDVRRELRGQNTTAARLGTIESRLSSLEGSILSAGRSAREAAAGLGLLPERLGAEQRAVLEGLVGAMRVELRRAAESLANNETTALARLDARLAAVEGSLSGLEVAQSEGLRRLSMSLNSALADAEATLQSSVRNEVARSMEPVRRLPQMLAAALPPALAAAEAVEASASGGALVGQGGGGGRGGGGGMSPEQMQAIVGQEVEGAVGRILDFQADAFGRLNAVRPTPMDDEQWAALGRRLTRLERLVEGVPSGTEGALLQGGGVAAAVAAAVREALVAAMAEARGEVAAAAAREAEGVRNDLLAAQMVLRESLDGVTSALTPLQLGVTELQLAVAAVAEAQRQQRTATAEASSTAAAAAAAGVWGDAADAEAPMGVDGNGSLSEVAAVYALAVPPPPPALAPAELARLLDGVAAVAQLLKEVDSKVGGVAAAVAELPAEVAAATSASVLAAVPLQPAATVPAGQPEDAEAAATATATAAAVAAAAVQQQKELQQGIEAMREALAALAGQVSTLASQSTAAAAAATTASPPEMPVAPTAASSLYGGGGGASDVVSFEASLVAGAAASGAEGGSDDASGYGGGAPGREPPATAGASRAEAYDMMLQMAEARRRSGSEAGSSSSTTAAATGGASGSSSSSNASDSSKSGRSASQAEAEAHLQIVGLPPFEQGAAGGSAGGGGGGAEDLPLLPPLLREVEEAAAQEQWQAQEEAEAVEAAEMYGWQQQQQQQETQMQQDSQGQQQPMQQAYGDMYGDMGQNSPAFFDEGPGSAAAAYDTTYYGAPMTQQQQQSPQTQPIQPPLQQQQQQQQLQQQQQQQPPQAWTPQGAAAAPQQRPPSRSQSPSGPPPGYPPSRSPSPLSPADGYAPSPQSGMPPSFPAPSPSPASAPSPPGMGSTLPGLPDYRPRPLDGLSPNEVISEGLRLLRLGREETRKGEDYGLADTLIQCAVTAFNRASELAPADAKALGNLGNALLARGELKAAYLEALRSGPPPSNYSEAEAQRGAEGAMSAEANALLTQAGLMFMKVLEMEGWSSRALVNWGRALVLRADLLAAQPEGLAAGSPAAAAVAQLYTSAINKFEGVLEGEPDMVPAKYRCALAMGGLSRTKPPASREALTLLADAVNYLRDVLASPLPDAEALRGPAAAALQQYETQLMAARGGRQ